MRAGRRDAKPTGDAAEVEAWAAASGGLGADAPTGVLAMLATARAERLAANDLAAEAALREAVSLSEAGPIAIAARAALGWHLHLTGHPDEADAEFEEAIAEAAAAGRQYLLARVRHLRGVVRFHRGRIDEAAVEFRAALDLDRRAGRAIANTLSGLGDVLGERGDILGSRRAYEEAERLAAAAGDAGFEATIAVRRAAALAFDDLDVAWRTALAALDNLPAGSYWAPLAPAIAGFVALARGDPESAAGLASRAGDALRGGLPDLVAGDVLLLRALSARPGSEAQSARAGDEALATWRRIGNPVWLARAEACLATGDRSPRGRAALERARMRLRRLGVSRLAFGPGGGPLLALQPSVEPVEVRCLGSFAVLREGRPVPTSAWQSRKARDLLRLLVANRGRPVPREVLMEALWPEDDPEPQANRLSVALATVRAVLDPSREHPPTHFVTSDGDRYGLDLRNLPIDVERFLAQVAAARAETESAEDARDALEASETAYSGDAFEDEPYADWAIPLREEARAAYGETARSLARLAADRGDTDAAVRYALRLLERDAYDEEAHLLLIRTLAAASRFGDARRAHDAYARRMGELGVEPAPFRVDVRARRALGPP